MQRFTEVTFSGHLLGSERNLRSSAGGAYLDVLADKIAFLISNSKHEAFNAAMLVAAASISGHWMRIFLPSRSRLSACGSA